MLTDLSPLALNAMERALCAAERDRAREVTVSTETLRALVEAVRVAAVMAGKVDDLNTEIDGLCIEVSHLDQQIEDAKKQTSVVPDPAPGALPGAGVGS